MPIAPVISKHTAEHYTWGGDCDGWHLLKQAGLSVIHERMPPHRTEVAHHHATSRQLFFVLTGTLTMVFENTVATLAAGEAIEIAPATRHQAANRSDMPVEFLVISQPPARGDRIEAPFGPQMPGVPPGQATTRD